MSAAGAQGDDVLVVPDLDPAGAVRLRAELDERVTEGADVRLDLSQVTHLSYPALAVLVEAVQRARLERAELSLVAASDVVVRVLRTAGLSGVLPVPVAVPAARAGAAGRSAGAQASTFTSTLPVSTS